MRNRNRWVLWGLLVFGYPGGIHAGLVEQWVLNEGSGATIQGSVANHGTHCDGATCPHASPSWSVGPRWPNALVFDGTNDHVRITNEIFDYERTQPFSACAWVYNTLVSGDRTIVSKMNSNSPFNGWTFEVSGSTPRLFLVNTFGSNHIEAGSGTGITVNTWTHVCVSYTGNSNTSGITFYVNASAASTTSVTNNLSASILNDNPVTLGARNHGAGQFWPGRLSDIRVYNHALTAGEVLRVYIRPRPSR